MRSLLFLVVILVPTFLFAVEPDEILEDPVLEQRARSISKGLRCVVCLNQDIDSSNAGVARDLRILVRERLVAGDTDDETVAFVRARYGDYVLLKPPLNSKTFALWLTPFALFALSFLVGFVVLLKKRPSPKVDDFTTQEDEEIERFIRMKEEE